MEKAPGEGRTPGAWELAGLHGEAEQGGSDPGRGGRTGTACAGGEGEDDSEVTLEPVVVVMLLLTPARGKWCCL